MDCKIIYLNEVLEAKKAMGPGRQLQVSGPQRDGVKNCALLQIETFKKQAIEIQQQEVAAQMSVQPEPMASLISEQEIVPEAETVEVPTAVEETPVIENAVPTPEEPIVEQNTTAPEISIPDPVISEAVIPEPTVMESPVAEIPVVDNPITEPVAVETQTEIVPEVQVPQGVEIISEAPATSIYTKLAEELTLVDTECDQQITVINSERAERKQQIFAKYEEQMRTQEKEIIDLKNRAEEYAKNARAAEQIAVTAQQNAMKISQEPAMMQPQVPYMDNAVPFSNEMPTAEIPSIDTAPILSKVA